VGELGTGVGSVSILGIAQVVNGGNWALVVRVAAGREWGRAVGAAWRRGGDGGDVTVGAVDVGTSASSIESKRMGGHWVAGLWGNDGHTVVDWLGRWGPGGRGRAGTAADKVEDVHGDTTGWLLGGWHVWVVRLKVAVKDVVVPIALAAGGGGLGELDVQSPSAGAGLRWGHVVSAGVVVPRAEELDALDVRGNQESEGVAG
jgi:hypothetical protein